MQKRVMQIITKNVTILGAKQLNGSLGPGTQIVPEPGPVKCLKGTRTFGTQMMGPECWDPNFWDPSVGTLRPRTRMKGPRYRDPSNGWRHLTGL